MKKVKIVIFCLLLFGCSLASILLPARKNSVAENRRLAQKPKPDLAAVLKGSYQSRYETYLNDQFFQRDNWVSLAANMQRWMGKRDMNGVYLGDAGYLLEKYEDSDFDTEQVQENIEIVSDFMNEATEIYGAEHVSCAMIPAKTTALSNRLPKYADCPNRDAVLASLKKKLSTPDALLDLQETLQRHQEEYIYYRTDHHWTTLGAYYAYQAWMEWRGQKANSLEQYERETVFTDFYGTTYNKVHAGGLADSVELFHGTMDKSAHVSMDGGKLVSDSIYFPDEAARGFNRYNVFFSKNTFQVDVDTQADTGKTLLLFKDSFANCFVPFLTEEYARIIMIDYRYGKEAAGTIMSENSDITDVLVLFNTEKFMQNTKLGRLADTRMKKPEDKGMEEFNMEDF